MALPPSFARDGFHSADKIRPKFKRLMMSIAGPAGTGKTSFALSAPGPGLAVVLDRGLEQAIKEDAPISADGWGFNVIPIPLSSQADQDTFAKYWGEIRETVKKASANVEARSIMFDGDSDSWELQRMGAFGKLTKVPSHLYDGVNAARRAFYARAFDSQKNFIATNRVAKVYVQKLLPNGQVELNSSGNEVRVWNGEMERKGFNDQTYLWQVHTLSMRETTEDGTIRFGIKIEMNKINPSVEGMELWGEECNFQTLAQYTYPSSKPEDWGYPKGLW